MTTWPQNFTGMALIAGEVYGVRAWDVDSLGRMLSPSYKHTWKPGENVAECQKDDRSLYPTMRFSAGGLTMPGYYRPSNIIYSPHTEEWLKVKDWVTRQLGGGTVLHVELDTRSCSYRAEVEFQQGGKRKKAAREQVMIAADVIDSVEPSRPVPPPERAHDFSTCSCGFYAYLNGTNDYADHNVIGVVQGYGETFLGTRGFRSSKAKIVAAYASTHADVERVRPLPVSRDRMRELYPDVAWFDDYAAMVAEFPPSDPEPTPTTDPEFWTRSA